MYPKYLHELQCHSQKIFLNPHIVCATNSTKSLFIIIIIIALQELGFFYNYDSKRLEITSAVGSQGSLQYLAQNKSTNRQMRTLMNADWNCIYPTYSYYYHTDFVCHIVHLNFSPHP